MTGKKTGLRQASVHQLRSGAISRETSHIAICMCLHPRNLAGSLRDEYLSCLAPDRELFDDFKSQEKKVGHDPAFPAVQYEQRFRMTEEAWENLERLASISREKLVYLVCQCATGERCHRELLLLAAKTRLKAEVGHVYHTYPIFQDRLAKGEI